MQSPAWTRDALGGPTAPLCILTLLRPDRTVSVMNTLSRIALSSLLLCTLVACIDPQADDTAEGIGTSPSDQCEDLLNATVEMWDRCGITPRKLVDCKTVRAIGSTCELYESCIPALATGCFEGDTPVELGCHQLQF